MNEKMTLILKHLVQLIRNRADELAPMSKASNDFEAGKAMAYYEVTGYIVECCRIFDIAISDLSNEDLDPDKLL
ncbi:hypothetical protein [Flavihumibacter petaseus]|uniref:Uncharacterized protein n=1 Tax=Flavihumibacter petaseus NBRC 106054 TaxID=1220578 RepID=A0A0E9N7S3_9BACT|nr:hypothetical protein [Flavihumibacter petaseus]GAO45400.1 hypothetical protein FPE01S_05_00950 [Flavihumibacter petaseus NBRC 106054]